MKRLSNYEYTFDGEHKLAEYIVDLFKQSKNFTLKTYPGRDEFYADYKNRCNNYHTQINELLKKDYSNDLIKVQKYNKRKNINTIVNELDWNSLKEKIMNIITYTKNESEKVIMAKEFSFKHSLVSYMIILTCLNYIQLLPRLSKMDFINGIKKIKEGNRNYYPDHNIRHTFYPYLNNPNSLNDVKVMSDPLGFFSQHRNNFNSLLKYKILDNVVPFVSKRGIYGYNTYLYMFTQGLYPVGISDKPYPVHYNDYSENISAIINHDFKHIEESKFNIDYEFLKRKDIIAQYQKILSKEKQIGIDRTKDFLIYLFEHVHEECYNPDIYTSLSYSGNEDSKFFTNHRYLSLVCPELIIGKSPEFISSRMSTEILHIIGYDYCKVILESDERMEDDNDSKYENFKEGNLRMDEILPKEISYVLNMLNIKNKESIKKILNDTYRYSSTDCDIKLPNDNMYSMVY